MGASWQSGGARPPRGAPNKPPPPQIRTELVPGGCGEARRRAEYCPARHLSRSSRDTISMLSLPETGAGKAVGAALAAAAAAATAAAAWKCYAVLRRGREHPVPRHVHIVRKGLCRELERHLRLARRKVDGDHSRIVIALDLDETAMTPQHGVLGTTKWYEAILARWQHCCSIEVSLPARSLGRVIAAAQETDEGLAVGEVGDALAHGVTPGMVLRRIGGRAAPDHDAAARALDDARRAGSERVVCDFALTPLGVKEAILSYVDVFYHNVSVRPSDPELPALMREWRRIGASVIGVTSRRPELAAATWSQMAGGLNAGLQDEVASCPLDFGPNTPQEQVREVQEQLLQNWKAPPRWEGLHCERGVWFTSFTCKGTLLRTILPEGSAVVFADDSRRHTDSVAAALADHCSHVASLHYVEQTARVERSFSLADADDELCRLTVAMWAKRDPLLLQHLRRKCLWLRLYLAEHDMRHRGLGEILQAMQR
eukprot:TRINITY_DN16061_c0_g1_i2.p1 TRINITY_DN16061_c0_g1~~TRINITY_DN16061_c0_g1_i2.p1  ORF type:complete len:510 (+),score=130.00 TRINITY_DN16061_c0_g1_i2:76-1530(+)